MFKVFIIATTLLLAGCQEPPPYEGELLKREGLWYKPRSVEPFSGTQVWWHGNGQLQLESNFKDGKYHGLVRF